MECVSVSFDFAHRYFDKCIGSRLRFREGRTFVRWFAFEQAQWTAQRTIFPVIGALAGAWDGLCFIAVSKKSGTLVIGRWYFGTRAQFHCFTMFHHVSPCLLIHDNLREQSSLASFLVTTTQPKISRAALKTIPTFPFQLRSQFLPANRWQSCDPVVLHWADVRTAGFLLGPCFFKNLWQSQVSRTAGVLGLGQKNLGLFAFEDTYVEQDGISCIMLHNLCPYCHVPCRLGSAGSWKHMIWGTHLAMEDSLLRSSLLDLKGCCQIPASVDGLTWGCWVVCDDPHVALAAAVAESGDLA